MPTIKTGLPASLNITPIGDQSIFVRASISGVMREAIIAAVLTGLMILLFLGSWRSTVIIAVSIPLSILASIIVLGLLGETINIMTLGGLALAVGILVDDATVTIENIERYLEEGHGAARGDSGRRGANFCAGAGVYALYLHCVSADVFSAGVARYLFVPLAEAVVFAMLASYVLSRTLVPTMAMYLLKAHDHSAAPSRNPLAMFQRAFERFFERMRSSVCLAAGAVGGGAVDLYSGVSAGLRGDAAAGAVPGAELLSVERIMGRSFCTCERSRAYGLRRRRSSAMRLKIRSGISFRRAWSTMCWTTLGCRIRR